LRGLFSIIIVFVIVVEIAATDQARDRAYTSLNGKFLADRLPIFVTLKEFAETEGRPGILAFMAKLVIPPSPPKSCGQASPTKGGNRIEVPLLKGDLGGSPITRSTLIQILDSGKALVLLDGLDEVMEQDHDRIIREIREFAEKYDQNHIVITCRIAAREYIFQQFTEVEMADFDDDQIRSFADKWFKTQEKNPESTTGEMFWQELKSREPVKELAANPLLLTLLCLEFDNSSAFPQSRSELYDRALNVLLSKWDGQAERATGIYSFSHLTFQEYFTAKNILDLSNPSLQEAALGKLIEHIGEKRWKEVILLVLEGLDNADYLLRLMKQRIDSIVSIDLKFQKFLEWVQEKSKSIEMSHKLAAVRAFYLAQALDRAFDLFRT
jgi:predicted NACHT family NTPase